MSKMQSPSSPGTNNDNNFKKRIPRPLPVYKRAQSSSPVANRPKSLIQTKKGERRCQSLSSASSMLKKSVEKFVSTGPDGLDPQTLQLLNDSEEKNLALPQCVLSKLLRVLASKKREFCKMRKNFVAQQNTLLECYAQLKELENRAGASSVDSLGELRVLSVSGWPAHDLLLLVRDDLELPISDEISGVFGPNVLQQLAAQLSAIPENVVSVCAELMARRIDLLNMLRCKHRTERPMSNMEWKTKNLEFDEDTEKLHRMVAGTAENLRAKINYALELVKIPWLDREALTKKLQRIQKENLILQNKLDEIEKKENTEMAKILPDNVTNCQSLCEELAKERAAREALKEVVSAAESMLRVARARISTLERQLKDTRALLETAKKKHRDLELLYRHRETSYDARSRKLMEVSKNGEITIETLSRQRDALELRVKELREQAEQAENTARAREAEQVARTEQLQAKLVEQEKVKLQADNRVVELEAKVKELEEQLQFLRERSVRLVDMERKRIMEYVPPKESEPSERETEIWRELQITRMALSRVEEELRTTRADKDSFLNSLSRIAEKEGTEDVEDKVAMELLDREHKIEKLRRIIDELRENEKIMEQSMTQYENQLAALRLDVKRLQNYDGYVKEIPYQELQTELLELHMQVETLSRERTSLMTAAASRALMLERHERAADLFGKMVRTRRELSIFLEDNNAPSTDETNRVEMSRSLSSVCATAADTWTALRKERARVLRLESAVLAQSLQLEREGQVRTQLERRRAMLEREVLRARSSVTAVTRGPLAENNPSLVFYYGIKFTLVHTLACLENFSIEVTDTRLISPKLRSPVGKRSVSYATIGAVTP
ncbi:uncharacterized protein LOC142974371 isoform X2 [Anticarsia gemmatalis]|uniref:uncharacterized protein LOC142974371 isoform X2 n=1 Tax=Anticarsia gemmatalis TaxID=129554 RepID=UPI003F776D4E